MLQSRSGCQLPWLLVRFKPATQERASHVLSADKAQGDSSYFMRRDVWKFFIAHDIFSQVTLLTLSFSVPRKGRSIGIHSIREFSIRLLFGWLRRSTWWKRIHNFSDCWRSTGNGDKSHPQGTEVINECFDAEGYNAFHRAAQGANIFAINKFLSWGANPYLKLKHADGFSPLWLSVLYSIKYTPFPNFYQKIILTALEVDVASRSAYIILNSILQNGTVNIGCNESRRDLTFYHIAAARGMW